MLVYNSFSAAETEKIGEDFAKILIPNDVVALFGNLGVGKTSFTRGIVKGYGIDCRVSSPTFALVNEYSSFDKKLYHFDMYRINGWDDLYSTGYFDYLDSGAVLVVEWSENIETVLPENCIKVLIEKTNENEDMRIITIGRGEKFEDISY